MAALSRETTHRTGSEAVAAATGAPARCAAWRSSVGYAARDGPGDAPRELAALRVAVGYLDSGNYSRGRQVLFPRLIRWPTGRSAGGRAAGILLEARGEPCHAVERVSRFSTRRSVDE